MKRFFHWTRRVLFWVYITLMILMLGMFVYRKVHPPKPYVPCGEPGSD
jgi:hypothetical protein